MPDPEIDARSAVVAALERLDSDHDTRARVLRWAAARFGVTLDARTPPPNVLPQLAYLDALPEQPSGRAAETRTATVAAEPVFEDFVDLFDAVDPRSDVEKALTGAYWLQVVSKQPSWQSLRVNNLLKETGHGVGNVTSALRSAQERKPALVRQVRKNGKAAQSWKTYKLTTSGVSYMRRKLGLSHAVPTAFEDHGEDADL
jgi:hypothetical protein